VGLIFATVALLYSVLMAFVVFSVWQRFTDSAHAVTGEAAAAVVAYRDTQAFPEPLRSEAQAAFRAYLGEVMDNEWASHGTVGPHRARDALNPIWAVYRRYQPTEAVHVSRGPFKHALANFTAIDIQPGLPVEALPLRTETVTVDGRRQWTDTGVDLAAGNRVSITATGSVVYGPSGSTGPNGVAERRDLQQFNVLNDQNHAGLIGRVGENGTAFAVGSDLSSTNLPAGRLFLGVNDEGVDNNGGAFTAVVIVRRA